MGKALGGMGQVRVGVLGRPRVQHEGVALAFPTRKALALFVYLVVEGGQQPREKLATLLWPDSDRPHARAMLRYTLADIRRTLHDSGDTQHITVQRETLGVDAASGIELDLDMLRTVQRAAQAGALSELRQVVACCRGEFLEGFTLPDAASFDEWTTLQRESGLRGMELVFDRLSQLETDCGDSNEATNTLRRWLAISPLDEEAHRRLMRLQFAGGDRSAALQTYDSCRALLERELHLAPAAETEALAERIRADGDQMRPPTSTASRAALSFDVFEGPLVGRSDEFARLGELYQTARRGQAQVAVLRGEPGIGKTRLAREFVGWAAAQGTDVLQGRAFETGGRLPYQPLVDALRPRLERENAPEDLLSDIWLVELGRLLPELRDRYPDLPAPAVEEAAARMRLFEAIARLGQALGQRAPVMLFVDDLQWADVGSLDALQYAARRWSDERTPVLVLLTVRSEALGTDSGLAEWLTRLPRAIAVTHAELGPLMAQDTLHFVQRVAAGSDQAQIDALAHWLHGETAGQPLFLLETLRALLERKAVVSQSRADGSRAIHLPAALADGLQSDSVLPPGVRDVIHSRLARLVPSARELLAAGSVLGQGFTFDELRQVARLNEIDALVAIDDVLRAHVVREATTGDGSAVGGYVFAHDKIRDVVYAEAGYARRRVFHRRALAALEGRGSAAQLAHHALAGGLDEAGLRFSRAAGDEAVRLVAARDAVVHYQRALELAQRLGATADVCRTTCALRQNPRSPGPLGRSAARAGSQPERVGSRS